MWSTAEILNQLKNFLIYESNFLTGKILVGITIFFISTPSKTNHTEPIKITEQISPTIYEEKEKIPIQILPKKTGEDTEVDVLNYIRSKEWNYDEAIKILNCESSGKQRAHNEELLAKKKGLTKYSSCGLFQINSPLCPDNKKEESILYDPKTNIDEAFKKWSVKKDWHDWKTCAKLKGV